MKDCNGSDQCQAWTHQPGCLTVEYFIDTRIQDRHRNDRGYVDNIGSCHNAEHRYADWHGIGRYSATGHFCPGSQHYHPDGTCYLTRAEIVRLDREHQQRSEEAKREADRAKERAERFDSLRRAAETTENAAAIMRREEVNIAASGLYRIMNPTEDDE